MNYDMVIARQKIDKLEQRVAELEMLVEQLRNELARRSAKYTLDIQANG